MRAGAIFLLIVLAAGPGACGDAREDRHAARLERELWQAKAAENAASSAPLETRTGDFAASIAEAEARDEMLRKELERLRVEPAE